MEAERVPVETAVSDHGDDVLRFYNLAKRAEWQVSDLPLERESADPGAARLGAAPGSAPRRLALGDHPAAAGR